jgi:hypothetical protein
MWKTAAAGAPQAIVWATAALAGASQAMVWATAALADALWETARATASTTARATNRSARLGRWERW